MRKMWILTALIFTGTIFAANDDCGAPKPCNPCAKPEKPRYVTIKVMEKIKVPVQSYQIIEEEVPYTVRQKVRREVPITVKKCFWEDKEIDVQKPVLKEVEKKFQVTKLQSSEQEIIKEICRIVPETTQKTVETCKTVKQFNPATCKTEKVTVKATETVPVTIYKKVIEKVPCKVKVSVPVEVEEVRKVQECVWEPAKATVKVQVVRDVASTKTVCETVPVTLTKKVCRKVPVTTYREELKCVTKKVLASDIQAAAAAAKADYERIPAQTSAARSKPVAEKAAAQPVKAEVAVETAVKPLAEASENENPANAAE